MHRAAQLVVVVALVAIPACPAPSSFDPGPDGGPSLEERVATLEDDVRSLKMELLRAQKPPAERESMPLSMVRWIETIAKENGATIEIVPPAVLEALSRSRDDEGVVLRKGKKTVVVVGKGQCRENAPSELLMGSSMRSYACAMNGAVYRDDNTVLAPIAWSRNALGISPENALKSLENRKNALGMEPLAEVIRGAL